MGIGAWFSVSVSRLERFEIKGFFWLGAAADGVFIS